METSLDPLSMATLSPEVAASYLKAARHAAVEAGKIQMQAFGRSHQVETKISNIDLVTQIDQECDNLIIELLRKTSPDALFVTEEHFQEGQAIDLSDTWVVDPLDGTTNYAHSFPHFAVSIAYFHQGKPQLGVVYDPFKEELFHAVRGGGAFLNDQSIHVSGERVQHLADALLATGFPYDIATSEVNNLKHFQRIAPCCHGVRRPGAAALDLAYLACGRLDGFWELKLSVWDIAAGVLFVEEAGGRVTDLTGQALPYANRRIDLIASNGTGLHEEIQSLLAMDR